jgi:hypothetical protein
LKGNHSHTRRLTREPAGSLTATDTTRKPACCCKWTRRTGRTYPRTRTGTRSSKAAEKLLHPFRLFPFADNRGPWRFPGLPFDRYYSAAAGPCTAFHDRRHHTRHRQNLLARAMPGATYRPFTPGRFPFSNDENEIRKGFFQYSGAARGLLFWTTSPATLNSETLCAALTSPYLEDRLLGASQIIKAPTNALFVATGNNMPTGWRHDPANRQMQA